jgi:hypothetical protein
MAKTALSGNWYFVVNDEGEYLTDNITETTFGYNYNYPIYKFGKEYGFYYMIKKVDNEYNEKIENVEQKIADLLLEKKSYSPDSPLFQEAKKYLEKFQDKNAAYSQYRKDNAVWITWESLWESSKSLPVYKDVSEAAIAHFGPHWNKLWSNLSYEERDVLVDYTGGGFSKYNKPLRGIYHDSWGGWNFAKNVTTLTNAIDKCEWEEDIWVQRGIDHASIFSIPGSSTPKSLNMMTEDELNSLVGTIFTDRGFFSAGAGKGTGFEMSPVIFNVYCPRGTKMAYMNIHGSFAHTSENEMILQRGYSFRITKVKKGSSQYFIDMEVILGSDETNNITDINMLKELGEKYLG